MFEGHPIRSRANGTFQIDFHTHGKRVRKVFKTLAEAKTDIAQRKVEVINQGRAAFDISDQDRLDIAMIRRTITVPLLKLADFWTEHHPANAAQMTVEELTAAFLDAHGRRGRRNVGIRRAATQNDHKWRLGVFCKTFGTRQAGTITTADVESWLTVNGWKGLHCHHFFSAVRALFNFGVREKAITINPVANEALVLPELPDTDPDIMPVKQVASYLAAMQAMEPDLLPREAIGFFCGVRPTELERLDWQNVSMENKLITIGASESKTRKKRTVEMPDNLIAWLNPYVKANGPVCPFSTTILTRRRRAVKTASRIEPPHNAARHCFASYHLAKHQNAAKTALLLGHPNAELLFGTYRNIRDTDGKAITEAMGAAYFEIRPEH